MLLFNPTPNELETKFDGQVVKFKPLEKRRMQSAAEGNHVIFKLIDKGLVELKDDYAHAEASPESELLLPFYIKGLRKRRETLAKVVQNFRTMNKEREKAGLSSEQPTPSVIQNVKDIKALDIELARLQADDFKMVNEFLAADDTAQTEKDIKDTDQRIDETGNITGKDNLAQTNGNGNGTGKGPTEKQPELPSKAKGGSKKKAGSRKKATASK